MQKNQGFVLRIQSLNDCGESAGQIGSGLRRLREIQGFSQSELARRANVNLSYVCSIENHPCNISIRKLMQLCNAMHIPACISLRLAAFSGQRADLRKRISGQWEQYFPATDAAGLRIADAGPAETPDRLNSR